MHAIELLLDDHEVVAGLFDKFRAGNGTADHSLFENIKAALEVHEYIEEKVFYPKLVDEGNEELKLAVNSAIEDHRQIRTYINELSGLNDGDDRFGPRLKILIEDIERYVEEEEGRMFPLVEGQFAEDVLETLGAQMQAEKERYQSSNNAQPVL
jgi:hemerythrin-like domain-containing protein